MRGLGRALGRAVGIAAAVAITAAGARAQGDTTARQIPRTPAEDFTAQGVLRVCADPNNLPFTNREQQGFENEIMKLFARDLGDTVAYTWQRQGRGFVRHGVNAGECDVVPGVSKGVDMLRTTEPYYRSTYVLVYRADRHLNLTSLDDPRLKTLRIGIHIIGEDYLNPPPAQALAARGIVHGNIEGYSIYGDYSKPNPPARIIDAVAKGNIDVAIVWGPFAGYFAPKEPVRLTIVPLPARDSVSGVPFAFSIAMGVRKADTTLAGKLNNLIERERPAIRRILDNYGIPLVSGDSSAAATVGERH